MLEALLTSKSRIAILKVLLLEPYRKCYLREIVVITGLPLRSVQIELKKLSDAGILKREVSGRQTYYYVNERCPIIPELRSMFIKTVGAVDAIRAALLPGSDSISTAFIYGSFARGDISAESDIDLFVIGDISLRRLVSLLKNVNIMRAINPVVMSADEFESRLADNDHFINSIMNAPKIFLIGNENGLK